MLSPLTGSAVDYVMHHGVSVANSENPQDCLACHAGMAEKDHHQILMNYPPRRKEHQFASLAAVTESGARFYSGYVTCVSCHDLAKATTAHLITDTRQSKLCLVCHLK